MKNKIENKSVLLIVFLLIIGISIMSFIDPNKKIIGTWISNEDSTMKWEFTSDGKCYWYNDSAFEESFSYVISETSPQCGYTVKTGGDEDFYLKLTDKNGEEYCYEILNLNDTTLSINYLGVSDILVFKKQ